MPRKGESCTGATVINMKIKKNVIKKLMSQAYKSSTGLAVEADNGGITISGARWCIWIERKNIPFDLLADIVEFSGKLPEEGDSWTVFKDQPPQERFLHTIEPITMRRDVDLTPGNQVVTSNVYIEADNGKRYNAIKHSDGVYFLNEAFLNWIELEHDEVPVLHNEMVVWDDGLLCAMAMTYNIADPAAELLTQESW